MTKLKDLLPYILPESLRINNLYLDVVQIIGEAIDENMPTAVDISKIADSKNPEIKNELLKTYLENITFAFKKAITDDTVVKRLTKAYNDLGMQYVPISENSLFQKVNISEYFSTSKGFKQSKGKATGIEYAYNLLRKMNIQPLDNSEETIDPIFSVKEGTEKNPNEPFTFIVTGSLYKEIYEASVKPIAHPVGFGYLYYRLMQLNFIDYIDLYISYKNVVIKVNCSSGTSDDYSNIPVISIDKETDEYSNLKITIVFSDNTKLIKDFSGLITLYKIDNTIIKQYSSGCSLFLQYDIEIKTKLEDNLNIEIEYDDYDLVYCKHTIPIIGNNLIVGMFYVGSEDGGNCEYDTIIGEELTINEFTVGTQVIFKNVRDLIDNIEYSMEYNSSDLVFEREDEGIIGDFNLVVDGFTIDKSISDGILEEFEIETIHI
jgi:hypothetical protein